MSYKARDALPTTAFTLPAKYYTDPAMFARECEHFYRRMWVCIGRAEELSGRGAFVIREIAGDQLIIVRASDDSISAFHNVCRHRGTRLCTEPSGRFAGTIQCPYHAWTYDYQGRLVGAPQMEGTTGFRKEDYPLREARTAMWEGHIFVCLDASTPALSEQLGDLPAKFASWGMGELQCGGRIVYDVAANWKLIVQNYNECLHCPNLHPKLNQLSHYLSGENEPLRPTYMGGRMDLSNNVETMSVDGSCPRAPLPGVSAADRRRVYYYSIFPNLLLAPHPDYVMTHTLWPAGPGRTRVVCEWHFHPREMAKPDFSCTDVTEFWDMTNRQDWYVCALAQAGISSRAYTPGPYSCREDLLFAFDRFIVESLGEPE